MNFISGEQLAYLATTFAVALANGLSTDEIDVLANFFVAVGDSLALIISQREACK